LSIGLASCQDDDENELDWAQFQRHLLSRALLHPNYGLIADPNWGETDLLFPFVVYEAKKFRKHDAWNDPTTEAFNQASDAAKIFLKMQSTLSHRPGPAHAYREPSPESESPICEQVFMFTSVGSQWHLHVGYWIQQPERHFYTWRARGQGQVVRAAISVLRLIGSLT
jgi:hypothetical protein